MKYIVFFIAALLIIIQSNSLNAQNNQIVFTSNLEMLSKNVNSGFSDAEPKLSPDGKRLYICRRANSDNIGEADVWYSELHTTGEWLRAVNLGEPINDASFNQVIGIRSDGNAIVLIGYYDSELETNLFISERMDGKWTKPKPMTITNFSRGSSYGITPDFQTLIISKRTLYSSTEDLFVAFRTSELAWSEPIALGDTINTEGAETFPTMAADGKTLYFSSTGHEGYGSYDIFISRRLDESWTKWSTPQNMGNKLNTSGYDADFTVDAKGEYAYISSNANSIANEFNIYRIKLPEEARPDPVVIVQGKVLDNNKKPLEVVVSYYRLSDGKKLGEARSNAESGGYKIVLPYGEKYSFNAGAKGYASISDNIDLSTIDVYKEITKDLYLVPIEAGNVVRMNNLFYQTGKSVLDKESEVELNNVISLLINNPTMEIEIGGHTDDVGTAESNLKLSQDRALSVANFIISKGIDKKRISNKGYGETKPLASNSTPEGKKQNRRVEFTILKK